MSVKKSLSVFAAVVAVGAMCAITVPFAIADDVETVTSSRSFPKVTTVKQDLLAESTSTAVDDDADWGGIETLDVPESDTATESDTEEETTTETEATETTEDSAAASRSETRESLSTDSSSSSSSTSGDDDSSDEDSDSSTGSAVATFASQFVNYPYVYGGSSTSGWDCSGFVMYVYAQFGVSLPHSSGSMMSVGTAVSSLSEAQPGDIIANSTHAAIYLGNGLVISALNASKGTQITSISGAFSSSYVIRRIFS